jgi:hypothetical protein
MGMGNRIFLMAVGLLGQFGTAAAIPLVTDTLEEALRPKHRKPVVYRGDFAQRWRGSPGLFCSQDIQAEVRWASTLKDLSIGLNQHGDTLVDLDFGDSNVFFQGTQRDGVFCQWGGGEGTAVVQNLRATIRLVPLVEEKYPGIAIDDVRFQDLSFEDLGWGIPGLIMIRGDAPTWMNQWVETNLSNLLRQFLSSALKERLDQWLTAELAKKLEEGRADSNERIPSTCPVPLYD